MYEEILGRPATEQEKSLFEEGFQPDYKIGDEVEVSAPRKIQGKIDGVVLFTIPRAKGNELCWGYRVQGLLEYLPANFLQSKKE